MRADSVFLLSHFCCNIGTDWIISDQRRNSQWYWHIALRPNTAMSMINDITLYIFISSRKQFVYIPAALAVKRIRTAQSPKSYDVLWTLWCVVIEVYKRFKGTYASIFRVKALTEQSIRVYSPCCVFLWMTLQNMGKPPLDWRVTFQKWVLWEPQIQ
jgi:hypothetical protein